MFISAYGNVYYSGRQYKIGQIENDPLTRLTRFVAAAMEPRTCRVERFKYKIKIKLKKKNTIITINLLIHNINK